MHRYGTTGSRGSAQTGQELMDLSLWQESGLNTGRFAMSQAGGVGTPITLAHDGVSSVAAQSGMTLIGSSMTNGLVEAEVTLTGWNFATFGDTITGGAAGRLSGTAGVSNWNAYFCSIRQQAATTAGRRLQPRRYVAGTGNNFGTETQSMPAGLVDGTTHIVTQLQMAGDQITTRAKVLGDSAWAHENTATDANVTAAGLVGVWFSELEVAMTIVLHSFTWSGA